MQRNQSIVEDRYRKTKAIKPAGTVNQADLIGALMRALASFPEARKSVIEHFSRVGQDAP